jgi:hypothetical protein
MRQPEGNLWMLEGVRNENRTVATNMVKGTIDTKLNRALQLQVKGKRPKRQP